MLPSILATLCFSFSATFTRRALNFLDYRYLILLRLGLAALLLFAIAFTRSNVFEDRITVALHLDLAVFFIAGFSSVIK